MGCKSNGMGVEVGKLWDKLNKEMSGVIEGVGASMMKKRWK